MLKFILKKEILMLVHFHELKQTKIFFKKKKTKKEERVIIYQLKDKKIIKYEEIGILQ